MCFFQNSYNNQPKAKTTHHQISFDCAYTRKNYRIQSLNLQSQLSSICLNEIKCIDANDSKQFHKCLKTSITQSIFLPNKQTYKPKPSSLPRKQIKINIIPFLKNRLQNSFLKTKPSATNQEDKLTHIEEIYDEIHRNQFQIKKRTVILIDKIQKVIDYAFKMYLEENFVYSRQKLNKIIDHYMDQYFNQHLQIQKQWQNDIKNMAAPFFETKIYNIANRIEGRAEDQEYIVNIQKFVEGQKQLLAQSINQYFDKNYSANIDHLFQDFDEKKILKLIQHEFIKELNDRRDKQSQIEEECKSLVEEYFQNFIIPNQIYTENQTFLNFILKNDIQLQNDSNKKQIKQITQKDYLLNHTSKLVKDLLKMVESEPEVKDWCLMTWRKIGPIDIDWVISSWEVKIPLNDNDCLFNQVIDDNFITQGLQGKITRIFGGIVRKIDIQKNEIYEGDFSFKEAKGNGRIIYSDGSYYIGKFRQSQKNGYGELYDYLGNLIQKGRWLNDQFKND